MVKDIRNPIIVSIEGDFSTYINTYMKYKISIRFVYSNATIREKDIYFGKVLVLNPSKLEIDITSNIQNNAFNVEYIYDYENQKFNPNNLYSIGDSINPIEFDSGKFITAELVVSCFDEAETVLFREYVDVTNQFTPPFLTDISYSVPFKSDGTFVGFHEDGVAPHVPYMFTDNYFVGFRFDKQKYGGNTFNVGDAESGTFQISTNRHGCYSISITLGEFYNYIQVPFIYRTVFSGGNALLNTDTTINGGEASTDTFDAVLRGGNYQIDDVVVPLEDGGKIVVDSCAKRWYISWQTPTSEWQSQGIDNVTTQIENKNVKYQSINGIIKTSKIDEQTSFIIRWNRLSNKQKKVFKTIVYAKEVLLYDTEYDRQYICTYSGSENITMKERTNDSSLEIKLTPIIKY